MKTVAILGASGMAREAGDIAWALGRSMVYVSRDPGEVARWTHPVPIMLESEVHGQAQLEFVIGVGDNSLRQRIAERLSGLDFINLIHPSATFGFNQAERVGSRSGVIICAGARLTSGIDVGDFVIINQNACVAHDVILGDFVHVAPGASISGNVHVEARCWIGAGAVINQGGNGKKLTIGAGTVVGSGAVVTTDCEPNAVYAGVPARRIK